MGSWGMKDVPPPCVYSMGCWGYKRFTIYTIKAFTSYCPVFPYIVGMCTVQFSLTGSQSARNLK